MAYIDDSYRIPTTMTNEFGQHTEDSYWKAVAEKDRSADGLFFYAVKTTGVFCRPGCSSRLPKRDNVEFYTSCDSAKAAGYRPCLKCRPDTQSKETEIEQKIVRACRMIETSESQLTLKDLAEDVKLSTYHFHRLFKRIIGVTPKQYAINHRAGKFAEKLPDSPSITDAIYDSGYSSSSGAYTQQKKRLSMMPKVYKQGAAGMTITYGLAECFLGWVIVAATDLGVCSIEIGEDPIALPKLLQKRFPKAQLVQAGEGFTALLAEVIDYIASPAREHTIPLDIQGTAFQQQVWAILQQIEPGETVSYTEVAERMGRPSAVRAVATACAANKIAVIIPCHRVITKEGKISGYRWGVERKKQLLDMERRTHGGETDVTGVTK